jgi:hypothetical protein
MFESRIQHQIALSLCDIAQKWNSRQGSDEVSGAICWCGKLIVKHIQASPTEFLRTVFAWFLTAKFFQNSVSVKNWSRRSALFWDFTRRRIVVMHRTFGTTCRSSSWVQHSRAAGTLKMGPIGCPKTSIRHYQHTLRKILKKRTDIIYIVAETWNQAQLYNMWQDMTFHFIFSFN